MMNLCARGSRRWFVIGILNLVCLLSLFILVIVYNVHIKGNIYDNDNEPRVIAYSNEQATTDSSPKSTKGANPAPETYMAANPLPKSIKGATSTPKPITGVNSTPKPTKEADSTPKPTKRADSTPKPTKGADSTPEPTKGCQRFVLVVLNLPRVNLTGATTQRFLKNLTKAVKGRTSETRVYPFLQKNSSEIVPKNYTLVSPLKQLLVADEAVKRPSGIETIAVVVSKGPLDKLTGDDTKKRFLRVDTVDLESDDSWDERALKKVQKASC